MSNEANKASGKIRTGFSVFVGKFVHKTARIAKFGSTSFPGKVSIDICPNVLANISEGVYTILVTGTNGKSTTTRMLADMIEANKDDVFSNKEGANIENGITTTYVVNSKLSGKPKKHIAVIECDELYLAKLYDSLKPKMVIITNLFPDQEDRLGSPEKVANLFYETLNDTDTIVCFNDSCDVLKKFYNCKNAKPFNVIDGKVVAEGNEYKVKLNIPGDYNLYNAAGAVAAVREMDLLNDKSLEALSKVESPYGRMEQFKIGDVDVTMNLIKNTAGGNATMASFRDYAPKYTFCIGTNNREEDGTDPSWINDVEFESYKDQFDTVNVFGECADELFERFNKIDGVEPNKLPADNFETLIDIMSNSKYPVLLLTNYSCMMQTRDALSKKGLMKEFWKK